MIFYLSVQILDNQTVASDTSLVILMTRDMGWFMSLYLLETKVFLFFSQFEAFKISKAMSAA
jgi:hypothetical protein